MRLKPEEISVFIDTLSALLEEGEGNLYLYGSRIDASLRGGDIDLLLIVRSSKKAKELVKERFRILSHFKKKLGDRRIDFSILSETELVSNLFYQGVLKTAVLLWNS